MLSEFRAFLMQRLPSRIIADVNDHLRTQREGLSIQGDMTEVILGAIQEVMEEFPGIPVSLAADRDATERMGSTAVEASPDTQAAFLVTGAVASGHMRPAAGWALSGTPMSIAGPSIPTSRHTIHASPTLAPAPFSVPWRPSSNVSPRFANTHPILPSSPQVPTPIPTASNLGPAFDPPAASTPGSGFLRQCTTTEAAPSAQAPHSSTTALQDSGRNSSIDWDHISLFLFDANLEVF